MIMKNFSLNFNLIYFQYLFLLALFTFYPTISSTQMISSDPIGDVVCELVNCGEGVCKPSNETLLRFDCECNPGWKKIQIGPLTFPSCVIPNCTINFQCDGSASPPPPPTPVVPPPGCALVWCGDGTCVTNGTGHICQCPEGTWNLLDMPELACFKPCYLGGDCKSKGFSSPEQSDTACSLTNSITLSVTLLISILLTWI